jgi:hypothetical protein
VEEALFAEQGRRGALGPAGRVVRVLHGRFSDRSPPAARS